eukprot:CAMPEP_0174259032 /NCGR_PEP_ID=MMETSP0439-20130205/7915_1 /TAXON_ID=0 /ORGANISM="Stereomyxa ramosa, Strain Chinc5" /LENGTH=1146 /DNA_ID=CAMNT_0015342765 /DNA_START=73 /DNA_END=3510 /DNA_ORIENTATION=+
MKSATIRKKLHLKRAGGGSSEISTCTPGETRITVLGEELRDAEDSLRTILAKANRLYACVTAVAEAEMALGEALKEYSTKMSISSQSDQQQMKCADDMASILNFSSVLSNNMVEALKGKFTIPIEEFIQNDLRAAQTTRKKFDKSKKNFESASAKVDQLNSKGKTDITKLVEAEKDRDIMKLQLIDQEAETLNELKAAVHKNNFCSLERLCDYFEEYAKYFKNGNNRLSRLAESRLGLYRAEVEQRKVVFSSQGGKVTERVRVSPTNLEFLDMDPSVWATETDKRKSLILQLVEDEKFYVRLLKSLLENYRDPLRSDERLSSSKIQSEDLKRMFVGFSDLHGIHERLLRDLIFEVESNPNPQIGHIFLRHAQTLEAYTGFVINSSTKMDAIDRVEKEDRKIRTFFSTSEKKDMSHIKVLVNLPCQRIKKYEKAIWGILEVTKDGQERADLHEFHEMLETLQHSVEEGKAISERLVPVLAVRNKLIGYDGPVLVDRHRTFVMEGSLSVVDPTLKKPEKHYFFLFNDLMLYTRKDSFFKAALEDLVSDQHKYKYIGTVPISESCTIKQVADNEALYIRNAFELVWSMGTCSLKVCASTPEKRLEWMQNISELLNNFTTDRVFGVSLVSLLTGKECGHDIPDILYKSVSWLDDHDGHLSEGIFRISGMITDVQDFKSSFDRGIDLQFPQTADPHSVAGVLKLWVRELPEPIFPYAVYDKLLSTSEISSPSQRVTAVKQVLDELPPILIFSLQFLLCYLNKVSKHASQNKMNPHNLSIVFGPNLLYRESADPFDCSDFKEVYEVVGYLIEHYESIFQSYEKERLEWRNKHYGQGESPPTNSKTIQTFAKARAPARASPSSIAGLGSSRSNDLRLSNFRPSPNAIEPKSEPTPQATTMKMASAPHRPPRNQMGMMILPPHPGSSRGHGPGRPRPGGRGPPRRQPPTRTLPPHPSQYNQQPPFDPSFLPTRTPPQHTPQPPTRTHNQPSPPARTQPEPPSRPGPGFGQPSPPRTQPPPLRNSKPSNNDTPPPIADNLCTKCYQPIIGKGINALNQKWHTDCFVCTQCDQPFQGTYVPHESNPYCTACFETYHTKFCGGCGAKITGGFVSAIDQDWHPECFICGYCEGSLNEGFFIVDNSPVCSACGNNSYPN